MIKTKLIRIDESIALVIDEQFLQQFGFDENSEVDVSVNDGVLVITPDRDDVRRAKVSIMRE